jgi:Xaa-Pro aminopeptidase
MPDRVAILREKMHELKFDAFVVSSLTNLRYLTGFTGSNALGVFTQSDIFFITDRRYRDQVQREVTDAEILICKKNLFQPLKDHNIFNHCKRLAFEAIHLSFRSFSHLREVAQKAKFVATENLIEKITSQKLPDEIKKIDQACEVCAKIWSYILSIIRPGMAELDLAAEITYQAHKSGADGIAFEPIVASGYRSAFPHGKASTKRIECGDFVVIDYGCQIDGFNSDITRTVVIGEPSEKQKNVYEAVKNANTLAFHSLTPNMMAVDLDKTVRDELAARGYKTEFSHSLGHGLGLDVHELPRIGEESKDRILPFHVFTIEPGLYIPGFGGVRIEDDVYLTETGPELLSRIDRELIVIE